MKNRLFRKFYSATAVSVLLSLAVIVSVMSFSISRFLAADKKTSLKDNCRTISQTVSNVIGSSYSKQVIENSVSTLSKAINAQVFITDENGQLLMCSCDDWRRNNSCIHSNGEISDKILESAKENEYYEVGKLSMKYSEAHYTYACPIKNSNGKLLGLVFASSPTTSLQILLSDISRIFVISAICNNIQAYKTAENYVNSGKENVNG